MSKMIDRVARGIWEKRRQMARERHGIELEEWSDGSIPQANHIFEEARAAIEAMREPTEEMKAVEGVHWGYGCHVCGGLKDGWHSMIDAALANPSRMCPNQSSS